MSVLANRGKLERAGYHLKKISLSACTQQLPALWGAFQKMGNGLGGGARSAAWRSRASSALQSGPKRGTGN